MPKQEIITADTIINLLCSKHFKDVCIPQCKTGPSWTGDKLGIIDLWTMKRAWSNPGVTAYEVKVSRNDFLRDEKWRGYLEYCNMFYFAAPPNLIDPAELPAEVGLLITSVNGKRLYTKKKAAFRDVVIPENLYRYLLMWRMCITADHERRTAKEHWADWLKEKKYHRDLGYQVSKALTEVIEHKIEDVEEENKRLEREIKKFQGVREILDALGLKNHSSWGIEREIKRQLESLPVADIKKHVDVMQNILREIENVLPGVTE